MRHLDATTRLRARLAAGWFARRAREVVELTTHRGNDAIPPRRLRARTGAPGRREFAEGGARAAAELAAALPQPFAAYASILDFGCGSGRVLPRVRALAPASRCTGCDVDPGAVAWAAAHHPDLHFAVSRYEPPLPFPPDSFDLVYSISVFSHLDAPLAHSWLAELARVLRPGGAALLSVHGEHALEQFRTGRVRTAWCPPDAFVRGPLATDEFAFVPYVRSRFNRRDLPGIGDAYGLAFHGEAYLRECWSAWFDVTAIHPHALTDWQDIVVLARR